PDSARHGSECGWEPRLGEAGPGVCLRRDAAGPRVRPRRPPGGEGLAGRGRPPFGRELSKRPVGDLPGRGRRKEVRPSKEAGEVAVEAVVSREGAPARGPSLLNASRSGMRDGLNE